MAPQDLPAASRAFESHLFDEHDDADDLAYKRILDALLKQTATPSQAAADMDALVTGEAKKKLEALEQRTPPFQLTSEEQEQGLTPRLVGPNPEMWIEMITTSIAKVSSAFPPAHPAQDALVEFLRELRDMPKHEVPSGDYTRDDPVVHAQTFTLWPFGEDSVGYLAEKFRREAEDIAYPFSHVETLESETQLRWSNLQSFITRLTVSGLIDCSHVSALANLLPSSPTYPDLAARKAGGPRRLAGDLFAASHWLADDGARRWVYERCMATEAPGDGESAFAWSKRSWADWKSQLAALADIDGFPAEARDLALLLRTKMETEK
ncbi:hypothetical protein GGTG_09320 [Gaeumannomyces tritici R3-111a-1]|uniref:Uncharacterized protein n=1 Tax=Gaeumannomyces tritici (strain R3-111a-1) TaxID=644352 RepID=J3P723_GAET3|nr:hypothetical protein GGTG_09320 [Gaeumannomyces tritici R3-111a-1]EJT72454.1 hypothetical protein GGTG_09320 [Gaeumannomyces tritici R3-111a-1]